jgi:hypothetical protein
MEEIKTEVRPQFLALVVVESEQPSASVEEATKSLGDLIKHLRFGPSHDNAFRARVASMNALDWPRATTPAEGPAAEADTAALIGQIVHQALAAAGLEDESSRDPLLGQQEDAPRYIFLGGLAPNGVPISISINVTP